MNALPIRNKRYFSAHILKIYKILYKFFGPQHWWPGDTAFEVMIGAILAQNTNWRNASKAIDKIENAGLLKPHKLLNHRRMIPELIRSSGFYKLKSKRLVVFLAYFIEKYNGEIRKMKKKKILVLRDELLALSGIGFETADSILLYALSKPVFVVDAYTRRIFSRHGFFTHDLSYDDIRYVFESNLPRRVRLFNEYHALCVKLGKEYCKKNEPLCNTCPLRTIK